MTSNNTQWKEMWIFFYTFLFLYIVAALFNDTESSPHFRGVYYPLYSLIFQPSFSYMVSLALFTIPSRLPPLWPYNTSLYTYVVFPVSHNTFSQVPTSFQLYYAHFVIKWVVFGSRALARNVMHRTLCTVESFARNINDCITTS